MEAKEEFEERRRKEISSRISMIENYLNDNTVLKHSEAGTGRSYQKMRNSRMSNLHNERISSFRSELVGLKKALELLN